jgi:ubiquinone/menaquinone biosynthesis C-methylase UbiE
LEIDSGFGSVLINLATEFHNIHFVGVDISDLRIKNCKQKSKKLENIQFIHYNCSQLDSLGLKFDLALVDSVFIYMSHNELLETFAYLYNNVRKVIIIDFSCKYAGKDTKTRDGYLHNLTKILSRYPYFSSTVYPISKSRIFSDRTGRWEKFGAILIIDNSNFD